MDSYYRPTWAEISLDALRSNIQSFQKILPDHMSIMAVVKANGYGHGAISIAKEAIESGASYLAVAFIDEAIELRNAGIHEPILVLGYTPESAIPLAMQHDITIAVFSGEVLEALSRLPDSQSPLKIHIKIDTGMGRLGLHDQQSAVAFIESALKLSGVHVEGLFTHYASADEMDKTYTYEQFTRFERIVNVFKDRNIRFTYLHAGNSATAIELPELSYNMLRLGISMYGLYPSLEVNHERVKLEPVLSLKTKIVQHKTLPPNSGVSYGATYRTRRYEKIATLPVGYADGYSRLLTGKANVLLRGCKVPVVGRICMDQCLIEVTDVPSAQVGDEVVLIGSQGDLQITADELADQLGTINYEITSMISHRVPRVYKKNNHIIHVSNPLI